VLDAEQHRQKADEIATRALTLLRQDPAALPLQRQSAAVILTVSDFDEVSNPLPGFAREVNKRLDNVADVFLLDSRSQTDEIAPFLNAARNADIVLLALAVRARSGAGHMALPKVAQDALAQLPANVKVIGVSFGSPYILRELPTLQTYFAAYGIQPVMQQAAARALFGESPVSGRLPVSIPGLHVRGEGLKR
jgi:beta-N-acetylhexosaminidase